MFQKFGSPDSVGFPILVLSPLFILLLFPLFAWCGLDIIWVYWQWDQDLTLKHELTL